MEKSHSDLQYANRSGLNYIVHNYTNLTSTASTPSSSVILNVGRSLIEAASSRSIGWSNVELQDTPKMERILGPRRGYRFAATPPVYPSRKGEGIAAAYELKEWGTPVNDDEIFNLGDLEEFQSTNLSCLSSLSFKPRLSPPAETSKTRTRARDTSSADINSATEPPTKRRKIDINTLYTLIPQPHIHPSPFSSSDTHTPPTPPFTKTTPIPIPPHTSYTLNAFPPPFSRSAWLVPVRGILPWDRCTSAQILDPLDLHLPSPVDAKATNNQDQITWTHASLVAFWGFLLAIRQAGTLGPIGVSFHAAPSTPTSSSLSYQQTFSGIGNQAAMGESIGATSVETATVTGVGSVHVCRVPLMAVDHIKIHHEATNAMHVRNVLDAWRYVVPEDGGKIADGSGSGSKIPKRTKVRVLLGAKLVLVDERSRGVLIS